MSLPQKELGIAEEEVIVASTGVIGQPFPIEPIRDNIKALASGLSADGNDKAKKCDHDYRYCKNR